MNIYKLINIGLLILNAAIFFAPKKPMNNLTSNGAGILALFALVIIIIFVIHLILTVVALYFNKLTLLKIMTVLMVPASLVFWYYAVQMIQFKT